MLEGVETISLFSYFISAIIGLCLVVYYYYKVYLPTSHDAEDTNQFDTATLDKEMDIFKKLVGENGGAASTGNEIDEHHQDYTRGVCEKYEWFQGDSEIEMYVPISKNHEKDVLLSKGDVSIVVQPKSLSVKIKGVTVLEDTFYDLVDPDECNWQFDRTKGEDGTFETKLWLTIFKNTPNARKNYWKAVLDGDRKVMRTKDGKPVHMVDPTDKNSIKEAVKSLKRSMKE